MDRQARRILNRHNLCESHVEYRHIVAHVLRECSARQLVLAEDGPQQKSVGEAREHLLHINEPWGSGWGSALWLGHELAGELSPQGQKGSCIPTSSSSSAWRAHSTFIFRGKLPVVEATSLRESIVCPEMGKWWVGRVDWKQGVYPEWAEEEWAAPLNGRWCDRCISCRLSYVSYFILLRYSLLHICFSVELYFPHVVSYLVSCQTKSVCTLQQTMLY